METPIKVFSLTNYRKLDLLVKQGKITSTKMIEIMNEAVYWEIDGIHLGKQFLNTKIKELNQ